MRLINTKQVLFVGFSSIFILMTLIAVIASDQMHLTFKSIDHIVKNNNTKTSLISIMLVSARERTISLQKMTRIKDAFDRDDEWMRFNSYGARFSVARKQFVDLGVSKEESKILKVQSELTNKITPLQKKIAYMAMNGELEGAEQLLSEVALPEQDLVFVQLYNLLRFLENESKKTVLNVSQKLDKTKQNLLIAILVILFSSVVISYVVFRRINATERKLSHEKERAQVTLHSIGDAVITTDARGYVKYMNGVAEELTESRLALVKQKHISEIFSIHSDLINEDVCNPVMDVLLNRTTLSSDGNARVILSSNKEYAIEYTASPIFEKDKSLDGVVLVFRDVSEMREMASQLSYQASHDELTGLINRREFENRIELALMSAYGQNLKHAMCYLDLDQFKVVNDTCGHIAGDELLRQISTLIKAVIRSGDTIARLGGDEFGILYMNCSVEKAKELAEKVRGIVNDFQFHWEKKTFSVGVSIGLVAIERHNNLHGLLSAADSSCYVAKDEGRNRIHVYNEDDDVLAERKGQMQWVHKITQALEEDRFVIYGQRMLCDNTAESIHFELLIRMLDENNKIVQPQVFIPAAERYNLMIWIDRWMIRESFLKITELLSINAEKNILFSINISGQSLCDDDFLPFVQLQFKEAQLDPSLICFEITETSAIVNLTRAQYFMATLKDLGCHFSLDDFGSGLSSFSYLKNLKVDYLKIDGAFVRDIVNDPIDCAMVDSINVIGHVMGVKTIAEYVDSAEVLQILREIGVDIYQGYEIAKPIPIFEIRL